MNPSTHHNRPIQLPNIATDVIVVWPSGPSMHQILLITRGKDPYKGALAFPGGFVEYNEDPDLACLRELEEECGIKGKSVELVTVAGNPKRDPRKHVISMAYHIQLADYSQEPRGKDEASTAKWYDL